MDISANIPNLVRSGVSGHGHGHGAHTLGQPVPGHNSQSCVHVQQRSPLDNDAAHGGPHEGDNVTSDWSRAAQHQPHVAANLEYLLLK